MNEKVKTPIIVLFVLSWVTSCYREPSDTRQNIPELSGLWFTILNDSSYIEVYFTDSVYSVFHDDIVLVYNYQLDEHDSLRVLQSGFPYKFKVDRLNDSTMIIKSNMSAFRYSKIEDDFMSHADWIGFIKGDPSIRNLYRQHFMAKKLLYN